MRDELKKLVWESIAEIIADKSTDELEELAADENGVYSGFAQSDDDESDVNEKGLKDLAIDEHGMVKERVVDLLANGLDRGVEFMIEAARRSFDPNRLIAIAQSIPSKTHRALRNHAIDQLSHIVNEGASEIRKKMVLDEFSGMAAGAVMGAPSCGCKGDDELEEDASSYKPSRPGTGTKHDVAFHRKRKMGKIPYQERPKDQNVEWDEEMSQFLAGEMPEKNLGQRARNALMKGDLLDAFRSLRRLDDPSVSAKVLRPYIGTLQNHSKKMLKKKVEYTKAAAVLDPKADKKKYDRYLELISFLDVQMGYVNSLIDLYASATEADGHPQAKGTDVGDRTVVPGAKVDAPTAVPMRENTLTEGPDWEDEDEGTKGFLSKEIDHPVADEYDWRELRNLQQRLGRGEFVKAHDIMAKLFTTRDPKLMQSVVHVYHQQLSDFSEIHKQMKSTGVEPEMVKKMEMIHKMAKGLVYKLRKVKGVK
jgi:hypothetical protein